MSQSEHIFLWDKRHNERHSNSSIEIIWIWLCLHIFLVYLDSIDRYTSWAGGVALMPWSALFFPRLLSLNMFQDENPILIIQDNMHDILPWIIHWCVVVGASTKGEAQLCHIAAAVGVGTAGTSVEKLSRSGSTMLPSGYIAISILESQPQLGWTLTGRFHWDLFYFPYTSKTMFTFHWIFKDLLI